MSSMMRLVLCHSLFEGNRAVTRPFMAGTAHADPSLQDQKCLRPPGASTASTTSESSADGLEFTFTCLVIAFVFVYQFPMSPL